jgi:hypothetical protein
MELSVKQRGEIISTFRYVQVNLMETLAAWVPTTPEMEVKLLFGEHIWDVAQHADALGKRTYELRLPLQHSLRPSDASIGLLEQLSGAHQTGQRIAGFYDVVLPLQEAQFRRYLDRTDSLMDAPTVRILDRILEDEARMIRGSQELRRRLPDVRPCDGEWLAELAELGRGAEEFFLRKSEKAMAEVG